MAFLVGAAIRYGVGSVKAGVQAHQDAQTISQGGQVQPKLDRFGRPKSPHPVYNLVMNAEMKGQGQGKTQNNGSRNGTPPLAPGAGSGSGYRDDQMNNQLQPQGEYKAQYLESGSLAESEKKELAYMESQSQSTQTKNNPFDDAPPPAYEPTPPPSQLSYSTSQSRGVAGFGNSQTIYPSSAQVQVQFPVQGQPQGQRQYDPSITQTASNSRFMPRQNTPHPSAPLQRSLSRESSVSSQNSDSEPENNDQSYRGMASTDPRLLRKIQKLERRAYKYQRKAERYYSRGRDSRGDGKMLRYEQYMLRANTLGGLGGGMYSGGRGSGSGSGGLLAARGAGTGFQRREELLAARGAGLRSDAYGRNFRSY